MATPQPERELAEELLAKRVEVGSLIPEDTEKEDLDRIIKACAKANAVSDRNSRKSKYLLAQVMIFAQKHPSLWSAKFKSFEKYAERHIYQPDFERSSALKYKGILEKWEHAQFQDLGKIPTKNMLLISKVSSENEPSGEKYLEAARTMSFKDLVAYVTDKSGRSRESVTGATPIEIRGTVEKLRDIRRFLKDPRVHGIVESEQEADILLACIAEFCGTHGIGDK